MARSSFNRTYRADTAKEWLKLIVELCILRREQRQPDDALSIMWTRRLFAFAPARNCGLAGDGCGAAALEMHEVQAPVLRTGGSSDIPPACTLPAMRKPGTAAHREAMGGRRQAAVDFPSIERAGLPL